MKNIITFSGAQGTGKSTVYKILKEKHFKSSPTLFNPRRSLPHLISHSKKASFITQCLSAGAIAQAYCNLKDGETLLTERSIVDVLAYTKYSLMTEEEKTEFQIFSKLIEEEQFIFYFPIEFDITSDNFREIDKQYQIDIDNAIKEILKQNNKSYYTVRGNVEERLFYIEEILQLKH